MLTCRREDLQKVNDMFGTSIEVEFSSSWLENRIEALTALKQMSSPQPSFMAGQPVGQPEGIPQPVPDNGAAEMGTDDGTGYDADYGTGNDSIDGTGNGTGDGTGEENETPEALEEPEENEESKINDLSQDEALTEILEDSQKDPQIQLVNQQEGGNVEDGNTESSEDETDSPAD